MKHIMTILGCCLIVVSAEATSLEVFSPGDVPGEFHVDSGDVRGVLRLGGISFGFMPFEHVPTETDLASMMGLLNYYRIFTTNQRYGESMRALPSEATLEAPDTLRVHWPADEDRPFALTGIYRWVAPDTVDLETVVEAVETLPHFDVFLASYLSTLFPVSSVYVREDNDTNTFMTAEPEYGVWQLFPRDTDAVALVQDGRWDIPPSPVDWAVRPKIAAPLIFRRNADTGLVVAMMARPEDCFAVFTPDRDEYHYSMYFSLFGETVEAGDTVRCRIRMVINVLDDDALLERYDAFLNSAPNQCDTNGS